MVMVFVQSSNGKHFLRTPYLTFDEAIFRIDVGLQSKPAVSPELSLGPETMRSLDQGHRQCRANRPDLYKGMSRTFFSLRRRRGFNSRHPAPCHHERR